MSMSFPIIGGKVFCFGLRGGDGRLCVVSQRSVPSLQTSITPGAGQFGQLLCCDGEI